MADQNLEKLKTESERLEQHTQKSVNWLLWAMLIVVCFIFISMILLSASCPNSNKDLARPVSPVLSLPSTLSRGDTFWGWQHDGKALGAP